MAALTLLDLMTVRARGHKSHIDTHMSAKVPQVPFLQSRQQ